MVGAGGHARAILAILKEAGAFDCVAIVDVAPDPERASADENVLGVPVQRGVDRFHEHRRHGVATAFVAIGATHSRREWFNACLAAGFSVPSLISPAAHVGPGARIGEGSVVCPIAFVGPLAGIGVNTIVNTAAVIEHEVRIGNDCHVAPTAAIAGRARIGHRAFIGLGAKIIDGVCIGDDVTVGAGAVVTCDLREAGTYVGVPARRLHS